MYILGDFFHKKSFSWENFYQNLFSWRNLLGKFIWRVVVHDRSYHQIMSRETGEAL